MNNPAPLPSQQFWRIYDEQNQSHCDYRLTLRHCVEEEAYISINYVSMAWSAVSSVLIWWRVFYCNQKVLELHGYFPRPKPIEALGLFGGLFNLSRMIHTVILVTDIASWPTFRLFMFDLSWQLGFTAFACYFFGVSHTLSISNRDVYKAWVGNAKVVDIFCAITILLPYLVPTIFNIMSGLYATRGDIELAAKYTCVNYYCWAVFAFVLAILILLAGIRLINLLDKHSSSQLNKYNNIAKLKTGALKVKITVMAGCFTLLCLAVIACVYASARRSIMLHPSYAITLASIVNFVGPLTSTIICLAVLLNPAIASSIGFWTFGSDDQNDTQLPPLSNIPENIVLDKQYHLSVQSLKEGITVDKYDENDRK